MRAREFTPLPGEEGLGSRPQGPLRFGDLNRSVLTEVALRVAERDGIAGLTTRTLARELGLSHTAIYHHVRNKGEVLDLLAEKILSDITLPSEGPWQVRLREFAFRARVSMLRVEGISPILITRPQGEARIRINTLLSEIVAEARVPADQREGARILIANYILGSVLMEQALPIPLTSSLGTSEERFCDGLDILIMGLEGSSAAGDDVPPDVEFGATAPRC
ncbi:MAG: TetR family transcriptional regulator [Acidimicrobiales bacterium]